MKMQKYNDFREWIDENTTYTNSTKSNIVSRMKRADGILEISDDPIYLYKLSQKTEFLKLTVSVKSQVRRAVKLYFQYKGIEGV